VRTLVVLAAALFAGAIVGGALSRPAPMRAAFPGSNGRIVFVTDQPGKPVIASMTTSGTDIKLLTLPDQTLTHDDNPSWSPGGTLIVFTRYYAGGNGDIWVMNANGTGQKRLTNNATDDDWPGFTADGSRIVFTSNRQGQYEIFSMKLNGTDVKRLTTNGAADMQATMSPNNDRIAFISDRRGLFEVHTMNVDGTDVTRETTTAEGDLDIAWSASGTHVYFTRIAEGLGDIRKVNVATNADTAVISGADGQGGSAPRPDGLTSPWEVAYVTDALGTLDIAIGNSGGSTNLTETYDATVFSPDIQPVPAFPLVDARFSTFEADIEWAYAEGITTGCSAERFCPTDFVTREQMASFLVRALGLTGSPPDAFVDDEASSHENDINRIAAAGLTTGCNAALHLYCPTQKVRRDEMASFLARALGLTGTPADAFSDDEGNTHELNINRIAAAGITTGCASGLYCPSQFVTRGQMAAFLHRAFGDTEPVNWAVSAATSSASFTPDELTITVGDTVTVSRAAGGAFAHNIHWDDQAGGCPASPTTGAWSCPRTFTTPGSVVGRCDLHTTMTLTVDVVGATSGGGLDRRSP
jgi:Tol biopolymer transport system component/plastocyanin